MQSSSLLIAGIVHNSPRNFRLADLLEYFYPTVVTLEFTRHSEFVRTVLKERLIEESPRLTDFLQLPTEVVVIQEFCKKHGISWVPVDSELSSIALLGELASSVIKGEKVEYQRPLPFPLPNPSPGPFWRQRRSMIIKRIEELASLGHPRIALVCGYVHVEELTIEFTRKGFHVENTIVGK